MKGNVQEKVFMSLGGKAHFHLAIPLPFLSCNSVVAACDTAFYIYIYTHMYIK